jgi:hypothetical protein
MLPGAFLIRYFFVKKDASNEALKLVDHLFGGGRHRNDHFLPHFSAVRIQRTGAESAVGCEYCRTARAGRRLSDLPWNLQWARRTHLYSFKNLTVWGLGLPLGILAWAGFLLMGWRILKGEYKHLFLWGWTAFYFGWQSLQFNPTMRYQLPVYPLLCMMAAWFIFELPKLNNPKNRVNLFGILAATLGVVVLISTTIWAFAFQSIYLRDEPRIAASRWLFQNAPGPVNIEIETADRGVYNQPLPIPSDMVIQREVVFSTTFVPRYDGQVSEIVFGHALDFDAAPSTIVLTLSASSAPDEVLARASQSVDYT